MNNKRGQVGKLSLCNLYSKNRRGLSTIVMSLLLILLGLVAVGIFWVVVRNVVQGGAEEVDLGRLTLSLGIESVKADGGNIDVMVKRNPGAGQISGIKFIFNDGESSKSIEREISLDELDAKKFTFSQEELEDLTYYDITKISIAPIFKSGKEESVGNVADVSSIKIVEPVPVNLVTNGDFDTDTDWIKGAGWSISGGKANANYFNVYNLEQDVGALSGHIYRITFTIDPPITIGSVTPAIGGVSGTTKNVVGTYTEDITATGTGNLIFSAGGNVATFSIDNVIVLDVT